VSGSCPSVLLVSRGDLVAAAKLANAGFSVVAVSPAEFAGRMYDTYSADAIIVDHELSEEAVALMERLAVFSRDSLRVVVGGDPADTQELRESGVLHHHLTDFDLETIIPLLRAGPNEDDGPRAGEPEASDEAG